MRCPSCMSEAVDKVEDERVGRACAMGYGATGGYACAATFAKLGADWGASLGSLGTPVGAIAGAVGGALLGGATGGGLGLLLGRSIDRQISREYCCTACDYRFKR